MSGGSNFLFSFLSCCAGSRPSKESKGGAHEEEAEEEKDDGKVHLKPAKKGVKNSVQEDDWDDS